jgi:hypothetical protein
MRTIIAGSSPKNGRIFTNPRFIEGIIETCPWPITQVLSGMADGVDAIAYYWALRKGFTPEEWPCPKGLGRKGGPKRNKEMTDNADALILIWNGKSPGSRSMKRIAAEKKLVIHEIIVNTNGWAWQQRGGPNA